MSPRWIVRQDAEVLMEPNDPCRVARIAPAGVVVTQDPSRNEDDEDDYIPILPSGFIRRSSLQLEESGTNAARRSNKGRQKGFAKGMFVDSNDYSHVVYCDSSGNPKGILSQVKGSERGKGKQDWLFVGRMKNFDYSRKYGIISCKEAYELYNCDVYIHGPDVQFVNGLPSDEPFGFRIHRNKQGFPQVLRYSVVNLQWVFAHPRIVCSFVGFDGDLGICRATNVAVDYLYPSCAVGDQFDFERIALGAVVSMGIDVADGTPRVIQNSVVPVV